MCTRRGAVGISGAPRRGRCPHRPVRNAALRPTGGHKGRPYGHAFGFFVGAAFMAARNGLRSAEALWESQLSCGCGGNCRGRCPHRPVPRMRPGSSGRLGDPPLRARWNFVGVDVLIDPSAKRPKGRRCKKTAPRLGQCHLVSGIECRATPEKNECIRQRMHFFWKKCMTRERIAKSAKKAIQNGRFMLLYK